MDMLDYVMTRSNVMSCCSSSSCSSSSSSCSSILCCCCRVFYRTAWTCFTTWWHVAM